MVVPGTHPPGIPISGPPYPTHPTPTCRANNEGTTTAGEIAATTKPNIAAQSGGKSCSYQPQPDFSEMDRWAMCAVPA